MRTKNSLINIATSLSGQVIAAILSIFNRIMFLKYLDIEYMGINTLFTSIISIITLIELGVGSAISVKLYKPIANNDIKKISAYMNLYKKCYIIISFIILFLGLLIYPIIYNIFKSKFYSDDIFLIYFIYLISTVLGYYFTYSQSLISANQKQYINTTFLNIGHIIQCIIQLLVLYLYRNFTVYIFGELPTT